MIWGIPPKLYPTFAGNVRPFLEGFAERCNVGTSASDLEAEILDGDRQVWCIGEFQAVVLTQVTREAVCITHGSGSDRLEWQGDFDTHIQSWARALGKKRIVSLSRPGWSRWAKARGYRETHREMTLELM